MMFAQALRLRASSRSGCGAGCLPCGLPETSYARQPSSGLLLGATRELQIISDNWHKPFCLTMSRRLYLGDLQLSLGGLQLPLGGLQLPHHAGTSRKQHQFNCDGNLQATRVESASVTFLMWRVFELS